MLTYLPLIRQRVPTRRIIMPSPTSLGCFNINLTWQLHPQPGYGFPSSTSFIPPFIEPELLHMASCILNPYFYFYFERNTMSNGRAAEVILPKLTEKPPVPVSVVPRGPLFPRHPQTLVSKSLHPTGVHQQASCVAPSSTPS
jgi:hypothetical protein